MSDEPTTEDTGTAPDPAFPDYSDIEAEAAVADPPPDVTPGGGPAATEAAPEPEPAPETTGDG